MSRENDFLIFGTYDAAPANILKENLEQAGIPVKVTFPGTEVGQELTAGAEWSALTLAIQEKDIPRAKEIAASLNIVPPKSIAMPKFFYDQRFNAWFLRVGLLLLFLAWLVNLFGLGNLALPMAGIGLVIFAVWPILLIAEWVRSLFKN